MSGLTYDAFNQSFAGFIPLGRAWLAVHGQPLCSSRARPASPHPGRASPETNYLSGAAQTRLPCHERQREQHAGGRIARSPGRAGGRHRFLQTGALARAGAG